MTMTAYDTDLIDTRDLVEELEEGPLGDDGEPDENRAAAIHALFEEISGYAGGRPEDGIQLIADSYFQQYAMEFADDIGAIDLNASWPLTCIDWEQAANELRMDYTSVEFEGRTYWYR